MKKITSFLMLFLMCFGMSAWAQNSTTKKVVGSFDENVFITLDKFFDHADFTGYNGYYLIYSVGAKKYLYEQESDHKIRVADKPNLNEGVAYIFNVQVVDANSKKVYVKAASGRYIGKPTGDQTFAVADEKDKDAFIFDEGVDGKWRLQSEKLKNEHPTDGYMYWDIKVNDRLVSWLGKDGNYQFKFVPVTVKDVSEFEVTYEYYINDRLYTTVTKKQLDGSSYAAPAIDFVKDFTYVNNDKVSAQNNKVRVNCTENLPFEVTINREQPKWYSIDIHSNSDAYFWFVREDGTVGNNKPTQGRNDYKTLLSDAYLWCFEGNLIDGFKIYNKSKNFNFALHNTETQASLIEAASAVEWKIKPSRQITGAVCFTVDGTNCLNRKGGSNLEYWGDTDAGSSCRFFSPYKVMQSEYAACDVPSGAVGGYSYFNDKNIYASFEQTYHSLVANQFDLSLAKNVCSQIENAKASAKNVFSTDKLYRIKNYCRLLDARGYNFNYDRDGQGGYLGTTPYKGMNGIVRDITCGTEMLDDAGTVWKFIGTETDGYKLQNMNTQTFIGNNDNKDGDYLRMLDETKAGLYKLLAISNKPAQFKIDCEGNRLHVSSTGAMYWDENKTSDWYIVEATELEVAMNSKENLSYSTLHVPFAVSMPEGVEAYTGSLDATKQTLTMHVVTGEIPANTGLVLKDMNNQSKVTLNILASTEATIDNNAITGTNTEVALNDGDRANYYVFGLRTKDQALGFYHPSAKIAKLNANKAYINTPVVAVNGFRLDFGDLTGIEATTVEKGVNAPIYDLSGRRVMNTVKGGIYIQNGKKFIVK